MAASPSIPRPLVRANQWTIVLSVAAFWITGIHHLLLIPLLAGLGGVLFNFNPVMRLAKLFLKKPMNSYIPEDRSDQRFNQILAVFFLAGGYISYSFGWTIAAYTFTIMVVTAASVAIMGFCVGCFIRFQWKQWQYRRTKTSKSFS
ncbi:DUF4395 domain-containing protein [Jeotgalibacillus haloalkalitolerans]|uniref:DUF4395 domain-containing protein n=1 Tax=Jeotgalibacillus haloalkalitolerans TaxID=3104292 RepID=A0ABU5KRG9_9BACL|nr:DUF4395 domain-containing protein [Jeotgalibacillus sp. HH7-29]MDZ5713827.1 DUF4395 domain-containing protein [Jeotgalibacillus sp. HH7-29]